MNDLPDEVLIEILRLAARHHQSLASVCRYVCRRWQGITRDFMKLNRLIPKTIGNFIKRGYHRPEMITWLRTQGNFSESDVCLEIARLDYLSLLVWAVEQRFNLDIRIYNAAATAGSLDILNWLYTKGQLPTQDVFMSSVYSGNPEVVAWCLSRGCNFEIAAYNETVKQNHIPLTEWLLGQDYPFHISVMHEAAQFNRPQLMRLFIAKGATAPIICWQLAAIHGHIEILEVLQENFTDESCYYTACWQAAESNQLKTLDWLHDNHPDAVISTRSLILETALEQNSIEVFHWGLTHGCGISNIVCEYVIQQFDIARFKQFYKLGNIKYRRNLRLILGHLAGVHNRYDILEVIKTSGTPVLSESSCV